MFSLKTMKDIRLKRCAKYYKVRVIINGKANLSDRKQRVVLVKEK
jgi:hypothetical protein